MLSIEKVKLEDLTKICPNYFYIKYNDNGKTGYNFLWCSFDVHNNITLVDPMDLTKVLTSLAYKVKDNSTFAGVARGLKDSFQDNCELKSNCNIWNKNNCKWIPID